METLITASIGIAKVDGNYFLELITAEGYNFYNVQITEEQAFNLSKKDEIEIKEVDSMFEGDQLGDIHKKKRLDISLMQWSQVKEYVNDHGTELDILTSNLGKLEFFVNIEKVRPYDKIEVDDINVTTASLSALLNKEFYVKMECEITQCMDDKRYWAKIDIAKFLLSIFDLTDLDMMEEIWYGLHSKSMSKVDALQVIINSVEGDYSQLSEKLSEIAQLQSQ